MIIYNNIVQLISKHINELFEFECVISTKEELSKVVNNQFDLRLSDNHGYDSRFIDFMNMNVVEHIELASCFEISITNKKFNALSKRNRDNAIEFMKEKLK